MAYVFINGYTRKYIKILYNYFLKKNYKRNVNIIGSLTLSNNSVYRGFDNSNYLRCPSTISTPSSNTSIILKVLNTSLVTGDVRSDIWGCSGLDRPVGFGSSGKLGFYNGSSWVYGSFVHSLNTWYWVNIYLNPNGVTISSIADNGYTLDNLPTDGWNVAINSATQLKSSNAIGTYNFGNTYTTLTEYFRGEIDINGCALYQDGNLIWKGTIETTEAESDYSITTQVAENVGEYNGDFTSKEEVGETEGTAENYDRYEDVPNTLIPVNGYTRKYYKTINVPAEYAIENYPRPVLTQNGTLGGNSFAVSASSQYNTSEDYAPYVSFKNLRGAYSAISKDGVTISESNPWEYIMYFPKAICITEINMLNRSSYPHAPQKGYIEGSNDNISYTTLCSFTNSNNDVSGTWNISIPNSNQGFYKYYKFKFTSAPTTDGIYVALGFPTWKHKAIKSPAYSYEAESTIDDYNRYEDVLNIFEVRI